MSDIQRFDVRAHTIYPGERDYTDERISHGWREMVYASDHASAITALEADAKRLREALSMLVASAEKFVNGEQTVSGIEDDIQYALEALIHAPAAPTCERCGNEMTLLNVCDDTKLTEVGKARVKDGILPCCFVCDPLLEPSPSAAEGTFDPEKVAGILAVQDCLLTWLSYRWPKPDAVQVLKHLSDYIDAKIDAALTGAKP